MNCADVNAILDEHSDAGLTTAERRAVDAHLLECHNCAAAWHAHGELLGLTVPAAAPALLDRVLVTIDARPRTQHTPRRVVMLTSVLIVGAALAAITISQHPGRLLEQSAVPAAPAPSASALSSPAGVATGAAAPVSRDAGNRPIDTTAIALMIGHLVRTPPLYPPDALKRGVEGSVTLTFDVTATGIVENASVTDSTDAVFDAAALAALTQWRYLPQLAEGKRVASKNVQTVLRFQLDKPGNPPPLIPRPASTDNPYLKADEQTFTAAMEATLDRTAADNFRGAELELDELRARYVLSGFQEGDVWDVYAYLYLVQGNYDRAIDAYETGIAAYTRGGIPSQTTSLALANLYFARHQYAEALRTLLRHKQNVASTPVLAGQPNPIVDGFIDRLRALGVTEETLPPGRQRAAD